MKRIKLFFLVSCFLSSNAYAESKEQVVLAGTCVEDQQSEKPTATKECLDELTESQSDVLNHYRAVPSMENGTVTSYVLIPKGVKIKLLKSLRGSSDR